LRDLIIAKEQAGYGRMMVMMVMMAERRRRGEKEKVRWEGA
jgi:hypothetical protein